MAAVAARHRLPLTVRGGGTGNYGFDAATGKYGDLVEAGVPPLAVMNLFTLLGFVASAYGAFVLARGITGHGGAAIVVSSAAAAQDLRHRRVFISAVAEGHPDSPGAITQRPSPAWRPSFS